jgi:hypothetical protein
VKGSIMSWWVITGTAASLAASVMPVSMSAQAARETLSAVAVVQSQVEAFNKGDADAFASFYADDVELFDLGSESKPSLTGRAALIARYRPMLEKYHPRATILVRIQSGDFVIDKERTDAAGRSSEGVAIYQLENGKIRRVWFTP